MRFINDRLSRLLLAIIAMCGLASFSGVAHASPFGQGAFGADVPFGTATSLTISLGNNVTLNLAPNGNTFSANGSHTINVTSTDPVGYSLYIYAPNSSSMKNGSNTIAASNNSSDAALANNTWGYNTTGSTTAYRGVTTAPILLKTANGPYKNGDNTTVNYGVLTDITAASGSYTVNVTYTAVALNN